MIPYIFKQGFYQGSLILRGEEIQTTLKSANLDAKTEHFLRLSLDITRFAETKFGMKTGRSYRKYLNLRRSWVTQIVMAAKKDKLEPHLFRYPIIGSMPYRGYFEEGDAIRFEDKLKAEGLDTYRRKVDAFSSIGWLPDPLLSSMFSDDARLIEVLFHEITHLNFYFQDEADFNEAFASWMGYRAGLAYVATKPAILSDPDKIMAELTKEHDEQIKLAALVRKIIQKGKEFYSQPKAYEKRNEYFDWIRAQIEIDPALARMKTLEWNNALVLSLGTYYELVPLIENYANSQKLDPKEFLALVVKRGPSIISEIIHGAANGQRQVSGHGI